MTAIQMTVTKALSELKLLDKRIHRGTYDNHFIGAVVGDDKKVYHTDIDEFKSKVKSSYNSVVDLISHRNKVKSAIVQSNAKTNVSIAGMTYTVAEAIERKSSIQYEQELLQILKSGFLDTYNKVEQINKEVKARLDRSLESMLSNDGKQDNDFIQQFSDNFNKKNQAKLVDPLDIRDEISKLETGIEDFLSEVDHELSVSNATTTIEV